jgi:hypothetical protein
MSGTAARNIAIVLVLALAVWLLPGGGTSAEVVGELLFIAFAAGIALIVIRLYRERRSDLFGLGDRHQALLYGGLATLLFCGASAGRFFDSAPGTIIWIALLGGAVYALVMVFRHYREYA